MIYPVQVREDGASVVLMPRQPQPLKRIKAALSQASVIRAFVGGDVYVVFGRRELADCMARRFSYSEEFA